jgi:hypothetical protein
MIKYILSREVGTGMRLLGDPAASLHSSYHARVNYVGFKRGKHSILY